MRINKFGKLKSIDLKNTKNWFALEDGKVTVKDFNYKSNGIDMVIGGSHGLTSDMQYNIKAKVPRKLLQANAVGKGIDKGLDLLQGQASKLGIDIEKSEFINVAASIGGTFLKPKIDLKLIGADGEVATLDKIVDEVKDAAITKGASILEDKTGINVLEMNKEIDEAKLKLQNEMDTEIKKIHDRTDKEIADAKSLAQKNVDKTKAQTIKLAEQGRTEGYKQADELVKKAGGNPFKKKAAEIAAKKLKKETDKKTDQLISKAEDTAKNSMKLADKKGEDIKAGSVKQTDKVKKDYQKKMEDKEAEIRKKHEKEE